MIDWKDVIDFNNPVHTQFIGSIAFLVISICSLWKVLNWGFIIMFGAATVYFGYKIFQMAKEK